MKKYKLIKQYLGCPYELNQEIDTDFIWVNSEKIYLKDYPENWEEVVEKDYEILSFSQNNKNSYWKLDSQLKETFCLVDGRHHLLSLNEMLKEESYNIHSVKRLSDGEVFTVGDKLKAGIYQHKINGFIINKKGQLMMEYLFPDKYYNQLSTLQHIKKPLFTTEDGVDVFEGDNVHWVCDEFTYFYTKNVDETHCNLINSSKKGVFKIFPTKEAAEEYILMNKPCLSINDVFKVYPKFKKKSHLLTNHAEKLISLAKSKL